MFWDSKLVFFKFSNKSITEHILLYLSKSEIMKRKYIIKLP